MSNVSGPVDYIEVGDSEANFSGSRLKNGMSGQATDTKRAVNRGILDATYRFFSDDSKQVLIADVQTLSGKKTFTPPINLAPGSTPGAPVNGDMWSTNSGVFARVNGVTVQLDTSGSFMDLTTNQTAGGEKRFQDKTHFGETIGLSIEEDSFEEIVVIKNSNTGTNASLDLETTQGSIFFYVNGAIAFEMAQNTGAVAFIVGANRGFLFAASTTAVASMSLPHGTGPTVPQNGDMWTTTAGLFVRINGSTVGPLS